MPDEQGEAAGGTDEQGEAAGGTGYQVSTPETGCCLNAQGTSTGVAGM